MFIVCYDPNRLFSQYSDIRDEVLINMADTGQNIFISNEKIGMSLAILCTGLAIILQMFGDDAISLFRYENIMIQSGEWWRLLSGHFIHLSWAHLMQNLAGMWILVFILQTTINPINFLASIILLAAGVSLGLLVFSSDVDWYVGLSGVLHGYIVMGALANYRSNPWLTVILLAGVVVKLIWEQNFADVNAMEFMIGGKVIYDAHFYGAITGGFIITLSMLKYYIPPLRKM